MLRTLSTDTNLSFFVGLHNERIRYSPYLVTFYHLLTRHPSQPTNHLDLASIDALKNALQDYGGGVILASHDQALIADILQSAESDIDGDLGGGARRGELWEVKGHRVRRREGGIEEYVEEVARQTERKETSRKTMEGK